MEPRKWLAVTAALLVGAGGVVAAINAAADLYGLFRSTQGRRLAVYGDARVAKYLLSWHYVPANFDAILLGGSYSANWDMRPVSSLRIYNESLNGGNIVEEEAIAEAALSSGRLATAFVTVHPALTSSHEFMTVQLTPKLRYSSLGSLTLWFAYKDMLYVRLGHSALSYDYTGTEDFGTIRTEMAPRMKKFWSGGDYLEIDPLALSSLRTLLARLRERKVRIVFVVPPTFQVLLDTKKTAFRKYIELLQHEGTSNDKWIDFTSEEYAGLRAVRSNFPDGVHLTPQAAAQVVSLIDAKIKNWAADGTLLGVVH